MDTSKTLILVIIGGLFYIGGQYVASQPQRVAQESEARREISVQGHGEVQARPDIAQISLGVQTEPRPTAAEATNELSRKFQAITDELEKLDIAEEDIKTTNLSIQPQYDYTDGRQNLRGYQASENVEVKVRNLDQVGEVVARGAAQGANQIGGINFTIDDPDKLQKEAEELAIKDARQKAEALARTLDVRLGRVKNFSASNNGPTPPMPFYAAGRAEDVALESKVANPPVPSGSQEITVDVTVTYELR